jgi:pimeloyl-ACP methyl ester carboxylesterase
MQVVVDGLLVNYSTVGEGSAIVLLHGWGDSLTTFDHLTSVLKKEYTVIRLDLPGFGKTQKPKTTFSLEKYADFLNKFLQKIAVEKIYAIVGHSNGGAIAIKAVSNGFVVSEKLVLLASSGVRSTTGGRKKILRITAKTAKIPTKLLPKQYQSKLRRKVYDKIGSDLFIAEDMQDTFKQVVAEDVVNQASNITTKTLLLYGELDTATPVSYGNKFHQVIKNSQLKTIPEVGHFLHHENSELVVSLVSDFLRES